MAALLLLALCKVFPAFLLTLASTAPLQAAAAVPAMYVLGDSLADVGNNNYLLLSLLKADFPHNGVDFPGHRATGRFSNGLTFPDFLAERLGITSPPPYLALTFPLTKSSASAYQNGVNFASGGAGISGSTNAGQCVSFDQQIDDFSAVSSALAQQLGKSEALLHLSSSIFPVVVGSNDIIDYVKSEEADKRRNPPQQFVSSLLLTFQSQLKRLYNLGARKFAVVGLGPVGCCPAMREMNATKDCFVEANELAVLFNNGLAALMRKLSEQLAGISYSILDAYGALMLYIQQPANYGFREVAAACCGLGDLKAKVACLPVAALCEDRRGYIFWDLYHPTESTSSMLTDVMYGGSPPYVFPVNVRDMSGF